MYYIRSSDDYSYYWANFFGPGRAGYFWPVQSSIMDAIDV